MGAAVLAWQATVVVSIVVARLFSSRAMMSVALCWTAFTFLAVWAHWLVILQLGTAWGTVWLLSSLFGKQGHREQNAVPKRGQPQTGRFTFSKPAPSVVSASASAGQDRSAEASSWIDEQIRLLDLRRLASELLATDRMRDDTRADLNKFLSEARVGQLHPDDLAYVRALHTRIFGKQPKPAPRQEGHQSAPDDTVPQEKTSPSPLPPAPLVSPSNFMGSAPTGEPTARTGLPGLLTDLPAHRASVDDKAKNRADQLTNRAEIEKCCRQLRIPHLVHFTRCDNLPSIIQHGLMSVSACRQAGVSYISNDTKRLDGQHNGTSLSIALPNYSMFYKYRQLATGTDWAVLLISPRVLWEKDCAFYPHNAADARMLRRPLAEMKSPEALLDMFSDAVGRDGFLRPYDPSDPQAEVMVYEAIEPGLIEAVAFETAEVRAKYRDGLGGLEGFYAGPGRGLFASRRSIRA